jgi:hypothetical protein
MQYFFSNLFGSEIVITATPAGIVHAPQGARQESPWPVRLRRQLWRESEASLRNHTYGNVVHRIIVNADHQPCAVSTWPAVMRRDLLKALKNLGPVLFQRMTCFSQNIQWFHTSPFLQILKIKNHERDCVPRIFAFSAIPENIACRK